VTWFLEKHNLTNLSNLYTLLFIKKQPICFGVVLIVDQRNNVILTLLSCYNLNDFKFKHFIDRLNARVAKHTSIILNYNYRIHAEGICSFSINLLSYGLNIWFVIIWIFVKNSLNGFWSFCTIPVLCIFVQNIYIVHVLFTQLLEQILKEKSVNTNDYGKYRIFKEFKLISNIFFS